MFTENFRGELISIGFVESEKNNNLLIGSHDNKTYGADFGTNEIFYMEDMERITQEDDPEDGYLSRLNKIKEIAKSGHEKRESAIDTSENRATEERETYTTTQNITPTRSYEPESPVSYYKPEENNLPVRHENKPVNQGIVRPAVSTKEAIEAWQEYQGLKKAILEPSDLQRIQDKDFVKKSGWRKFATFYNLTDRIVEEHRIDNGNAFIWKVKVECTAPTGRIVEGVAMCSSSEKSGNRIEHDVYSTAHTRAKNRAISDMIGAGEVSAEEMHQEVTAGGVY